VVRFGERAHGAATEGWGVFFPPGIIAAEAPGKSLGWKSHPLLSGFAARPPDGARRLPVPAGERAAWSQHGQAIERELREPRAGSETLPWRT